MNIVLYEPEMPANTGNIGRTCVATNTKLHLIEPLGFKLSEKHLVRAGLDYWDKLDVTVYSDYQDFLKKNPGAKIYMATTKGEHVYTDVPYDPDAYIMFGPESRGIPEEIIMRTVDVMLSFPSQIMVFAVVALLGINVQNVILANVFIKWAWYARMIRTGVMQHRDRNFVQFSRCVGTPERFILFRHLLPSITSDLVVLASLDVGWAIINISTLSFLGLGVQAPTPEWGAMLNEAKNVMTSNPVQMIAPGIAIVVLVCVFNLMGDALRDVLDPKEVQK